LCIAGLPAFYILPTNNQSTGAESLRHLSFAAFQRTPTRRLHDAIKHLLHAHQVAFGLRSLTVGKRSKLGSHYSGFLIEPVAWPFTDGSRFVTIGHSRGGNSPSAKPLTTERCRAADVQRPPPPAAGRTPPSELQVGL